MNPGVKKISYQSPYNLDLIFTNCQEKLFSFSPYLEVPVYQQLKNEAFAQKFIVLMEP